MDRGVFYRSRVRDPPSGGVTLADRSAFQADTLMSAGHFDIIPGLPWVCPIILRDKAFLTANPSGCNSEVRMHRIARLDLSQDQSNSGRITTCIDVPKDQTVC
jgi:hypothetical protein